MPAGNVKGACLAPSLFGLTCSASWRLVAIFLSRSLSVSKKSIQQKTIFVLQISFINSVVIILVNKGRCDTTVLLPLVSSVSGISNYTWRKTINPKGFAAAQRGGMHFFWQYRIVSVLQAHAGPVLKVVWAPPEFGDIVASCSVDGSVSLWEEVQEGKFHFHLPV